MYVMAPFMETQYERYRYSGNYHLSDLPDKFIFEYDTGDGWEFDCKKYKEKVKIESTKDIILIEGKGQGIWEDNVYTLQALFAGEIDPDSTLEDEENGIYKPWNFDIDKYGDFDKPLNIETENKALDKNFQYNYKELVKMEKAYIKENNVSLEEHSENNPNYRLKNALLIAVSEQINNLDYVREIYFKLKKTMGDMKAREAIATILVRYMYDLEKEHIAFDEDEYIKRLKTLIKDTNGSFS